MCIAGDMEDLLLVAVSSAKNVMPQKYAFLSFYASAPPSGKIFKSYKLMGL